MALPARFVRARQHSHAAVLRRRLGDGDPGRAQFRVAPATLAFEDVTDLAVGVNFGAGGYAVSLRAQPVLLDEQRLLPASRPGTP